MHEVDFLKSRPELELEDVSIENIHRKTDISVEQKQSVVLEKLSNIDDKPSTSKSFDNDLHECMNDRPDVDGTDSNMIQMDDMEINSKGIGKPSVLRSSNRIKDIPRVSYNENEIDPDNYNNDRTIYYL